MPPQSNKTHNRRDKLSMPDRGAVAAAAFICARSVSARGIPEFLENWEHTNGSSGLFFVFIIQ